MTMSDRIAVMRDGEIVQIGSPSEVYLHPGTAFVASFLGETNLLPVRLESSRQRPGRGDGFTATCGAARGSRAEAVLRRPAKPGWCRCVLSASGSLNPRSRPSRSPMACLPAIPSWGGTRARSSSRSGNRSRSARPMWRRHSTERSVPRFVSGGISMMPSCSPAGLLAPCRNCRNAQAKESRDGTNDRSPRPVATGWAGRPGGRCGVVLRAAGVCARQDTECRRLRWGAQ